MDGTLDITISNQIGVVTDIAPAGWHVPTITEWEILSTYLGGDSISGAHLKEVGLTHWATPNTGADNSSGFTALGGGTRDLGLFDYLLIFGWFWASTNSGGLGDSILLAFDNTNSAIQPWYNESGLSIRFIKDDSIPADCIDVDGNNYGGVLIGTQVWAERNFKGIHYNDGTPIPLVTDNAEWAALTTGAMCWYDNIES